MDQLYKPKELAVLLRMNLNVVYRHLNEGKIRGRKIGGSWRITDAEVRRLTGEAASN